LHPTDALLGLPEVESIEHLWTLWLGAHHGPLVIDTDLASYPYGYRWVLADPLDLLWFLPAGLLSPVLGFHAVQVANLLCSGLVAWVAGRLLLPPGPRPPLGLTAGLAIVSTPLAGTLLTGMTEAGTLWAAVLAVALLRPALERGGRFVLVAALAGGLAAWGGAYTATYAALLAPVVLLALLPGALRRDGAAVVLGRLLGVALPALLLAAPVIWAIATQRPPGLPGATSMLPEVLHNPQLPQARALGADPMMLLLPMPPAQDTQIHAVTLGLPALLLGAVGAWSRRARLLPALLAWALILSLGVYLQFGPLVPRLHGRLLLLPAGLLSLVLEPLGHAARWHRMAAVAALLLAPLCVAGIQALAARLPTALRRPAVTVLVLGLVLEAIRYGPLPWPRPMLPVAPPAIYAALPEPGPILVIPKQPRKRTGQPWVPARELLWQTLPGQPLAERPMYQTPDPRLEDLREAIVSAARRGDSQKARRARQALAELGYRWIVHHEEPGTPTSAASLRAVLGAPDLEVGDSLAWRP